ncbi:hypothetical protein ACIQBJ_06290 [Kitasatospora sp. NPDC088391]|uniref:hypothetical protein n=1 Tax=Kitasatospora sp. NPDC088391 TaxID=3364074 RepID=UPI003812BD5F
MDDLIDVFRARDAPAVRAVLPAGAPREVFDTVPDVSAAVLDLLEELLPAAAETEGLTCTVWPTVPWPGCLVPAGHPWRTGPWAYELHPAVLAGLAGTPPTGLLALRPYGRPLPVGTLAALAPLTGLARRAAAGGERLFYGVAPRGPEEA